MKPAAFQNPFEAQLDRERRTVLLRDAVAGVR